MKLRSHGCDSVIRTPVQEEGLLALAKNRSLVFILLAVALAFASAAYTVAWADGSGGDDDAPPASERANDAKADGDEELRDRDKNKLFDNLEKRLDKGKDQDKFSVILVFDGALRDDDIEELKAELGDFKVKSRFRSINAFEVTLSKGQIKKAAATGAGLLQIEHNGVASAALDIHAPLRRPEGQDGLRRRG